MEELEVLGIDKANDIITQCHNIRTKWWDLGIKLGVLYSALEAIEANHRGDVGRCLSVLISTWLRRAKGDVKEDVRPTWKSLCVAVSYIDQSLAETIATRHHGCGYINPIGTADTPTSAPPPPNTATVTPEGTVAGITSESLPPNPATVRTPEDGGGLTESNDFSIRYAWKLQKIFEQYGWNGSETTIAILDTRVDWTSHALNKKCKMEHIMLQNDDEKNDSAEHGTVCATVAAGHSCKKPATEKYSGGVAPEANLISYRVAKKKSYNCAAILEALEHIRIKNLDKFQVYVVLMSFSFVGTNEEEKKLGEIIKTLSESGVILVAAAGKYGKYLEAELPASLPQVISVGGLDDVGDRLRRTPRPDFITVFAPGVYSVPSGSHSGTSIAAAAVAGLISLLIQCVKKSFPGEPDLIKRLSEPEILKQIFSDHMARNPPYEYDWEKKCLDPYGFFELASGNNHQSLRNILEPGQFN